MSDLPKCPKCGTTMQESIQGPPEHAVVKGYQCPKCTYILNVPEKKQP